MFVQQIKFETGPDRTYRSYSSYRKDGDKPEEF